MKTYVVWNVHWPDTLHLMFGSAQFVVFNLKWNQTMQPIIEVDGGIFPTMKLPPVPWGLRHSIFSAHKWPIRHFRTCIMFQIVPIIASLTAPDRVEGEYVNYKYCIVTSRWIDLPSPFEFVLTQDTLNGVADRCHINRKRISHHWPCYVIFWNLMDWQSAIGNIEAWMDLKSTQK